MQNFPIKSTKYNLADKVICIDKTQPQLYMNIGEVKKAETKNDSTIGVVFERPVKGQGRTLVGSYVKQGFTSLVKAE